MPEFLFSQELLIEDIKDSNLKFRPLKKCDFKRGFLPLLGQLTSLGSVSEIDFSKTFESLRSKGDYFIVVVEDTSTSKIVGTATLLLEKKFIHSCGVVGHIEDVVVDKQYRGKQLGLRLIEQLKYLAQKKLGCYKLLLDCSDQNVPFYEKAGLKKKEVQMVMYFPENEKQPLSHL